MRIHSRAAQFSCSRLARGRGRNSAKWTSPQSAPQRHDSSNDHAPPDELCISPKTVTEAPLRFLRLWQTVGVLLIGFVVYLSLTPDLINLPVEQGDKDGHVLAYATL